MKIGTISQKPAQVLANLETALPEVVKHIKGGWDNVQSFFLKTNSSAALPIWQCNLGAESGARWDGLVASLSDSDDEESGGRLALGGGGKVVGVLVGLGESNVGESRPALGVSSIWCEGLRSHNGFRRDVISTALV